MFNQRINNLMTANRAYGSTNKNPLITHIYVYLYIIQYIHQIIMEILKKVDMLKYHETKLKQSRVKNPLMNN